MISHDSFYGGDTWNSGVYDIRENKPYSGSDSLPDIAVDTGKPANPSFSVRVEIMLKSRFDCQNTADLHLTQSPPRGI